MSLLTFSHPPNPSSNLTTPPSHRLSLFLNPTDPNDALSISPTHRVRKSMLPTQLLHDLKVKGVPPLRHVTLIKWLSFYATQTMHMPCVSVCIELLRFLELSRYHVQFQYYDENGSLLHHLQSHLASIIIQLTKKQVGQSVALAMRTAWLLEWYGVENAMFRDGGPLLGFLADEAWTSWHWSVIFAPKRLLLSVLQSKDVSLSVPEDDIFRAVLAWCIVRVKLEEIFGETGAILREDRMPRVGEFATWIVELTSIAMERQPLSALTISVSGDRMYLTFKGFDFAEVSMPTVKRYLFDNFIHHIYFERMRSARSELFKGIFNRSEYGEIGAAISKKKNFTLFGKKYKGRRSRGGEPIGTTSAATELMPQVNQRCVDRLYHISPEMVSAHNLFLPEFSLLGHRWSLAMRHTDEALAIYLYDLNIFQGEPFRKAPTLKVRISIVHQNDSMLNRCLTFDQEWQEAAFGFDDFIPIDGLWESDYCDASGALVVALRVEVVGV